MTLTVVETFSSRATNNPFGAKGMRS